LSATCGRANAEWTHLLPRGLQGAQRVLEAVVSSAPYSEHAPTSQTGVLALPEQANVPIFESPTLLLVACAQHDRRGVRTPSWRIPCGQEGSERAGASVTGCNRTCTPAGDRVRTHAPQRRRIAWCFYKLENASKQIALSCRRTLITRWFSAQRNHGSRCAPVTQLLNSERTVWFSELIIFFVASQSLS